MKIIFNCNLYNKWIKIISQLIKSHSNLKKKKKKFMNIQTALQSENSMIYLMHQKILKYTSQLKTYKILFGN